MSELCAYCLDQLDAVIAEGVGAFGLCEECDAIDPDEITRIVTKRKADFDVLCDFAHHAGKACAAQVQSMLADSIYANESLDELRRRIDPNWKPKTAENVEHVSEDCETGGSFKVECHDCIVSRWAYRHPVRGWVTICQKHTSGQG